MDITPIAHLRSDFPTKFGLPRQGTLAADVLGRVEFLPEFRNADALRGIEGFSHLWLLWGFSGNRQEGWNPTVRPPRLGGNTRVGVFATRSPYRPNPIGMTCVKLESVDYDGENAPVLYISGVDMMDMTPIYDIKPYIPYADCIPQATGGFTDEHQKAPLTVDFPEELLELISPSQRQSLICSLSNDPRPAYQNDPERIYGLDFAEFDVRFSVDGTVLTVHQVNKVR